MANMAVCKANNGDMKKAEKYIKVAKKEAVSKHQKAVVKFCEALIDLTNGNKEMFYKNLKAALEFSKNPVTEYCKYSTLLGDVSDEEQYKELLQISR